MTWMNSDGLFIKFAREEASKNRGGEVSSATEHLVEFLVDWKDLLSATPAVLGSVATVADPVLGSFGVVVPKGARIKALEVLVKTAFTSSGTIGSSTMLIGLKKASDRSTEIDHDGFTTASFVGGVFDGAGERTYIVPGVTGAGVLYGTTTADPGVICVSNSAHASHPYTAGLAVCRLFYYLP